MKLSFTYAWSGSTSALEVIYTLLPIAAIEGTDVKFIGSTSSACVTLTRRSTYECACIVATNACRTRNATSNELRSFSFADLTSASLATSLLGRSTSLVRSYGS